MTVDRLENILSTKHFVFDIRLFPLGHPREISLRVGYVNPALAVQATATAPTAAGGTA